MIRSLLRWIRPDTRYARYGLICPACRYALRERTRAYQRAEFWQGKYHTLKLENNALRRKLHLWKEKTDGTH